MLIHAYSKFLELIKFNLRKFINLCNAALMRMLLILSLIVAALSFTGSVKAADFCVDHDCYREMTISHDDAPSNTPEQPCSDCCLHHCGHVLFSGKIQNPQSSLLLRKFHLVEPPMLQGREPSGLFRPPQAA